MQTYKKALLSMKNLDILLIIIKRSKLNKEIIFKFIESDPNYTNKLDKIMGFLDPLEDEKTKIIIFCEFILNFPLNKEGIDDLFSYFDGERFKFSYLFRKKIEYINMILSLIGEINYYGTCITYPWINSFSKLRSIIQEQYYTNFEKDFEEISIKEQYYFGEDQ